MRLEQGIPVGRVAGEVPDLGDARPGGRLVDMGAQPLARLGVAKVEQLLLAITAKQSGRIVRVKKSAGVGPSRSPFRAVLVELARGPLAFPFLEQPG